MGLDGFIVSIDTILYGRVSYDAWENYQPDTNATPAEKALWEGVHAKKKYVCSHQSRQDDKAIFINGSISDHVREIKAQEGRDI